MLGGRSYRLALAKRVPELGIDGIISAEVKEGEAGKVF